MQPTNEVHNQARGGRLKDGQESNIKTKLLIKSAIGGLGNVGCAVGGGEVHSVQPSASG